jgi:hypothetical protein
VERDLSTPRRSSIGEPERPPFDGEAQFECILECMTDAVGIFTGIGAYSSIALS